MIPIGTPPIALLTDFGLEGPYVGQMKGVLARLAPGHPVIDLTHAVAPQDVREGAFLLEVSWRHFPEGTVFVAVVDPGVGTDRAPIALNAGGMWFVGPDNGLLTGALPPDAIDRAVRLDNPSYRIGPVSATFHGRDLFAPAGAALATGVPPDKLGPPVESLILLAGRYPAVSPERIEGRIVHVDRFGNLVSDISRATWETWPGGRGRDPSTITFSIGGRDGGALRGLRRTYADVPAGESLALFGSLGYLEVAVHGGSAADQLGAGRGTFLTVTPS